MQPKTHRLRDFGGYDETKPQEEEQYDVSGDTQKIE